MKDVLFEMRNLIHALIHYFLAAKPLPAHAKAIKQWEPCSELNEIQLLDEHGHVIEEMPIAIYEERCAADYWRQNGREARRHIRRAELSGGQHEKPKTFRD